jgi:UDP-N-acetylmuramoyl-L-alanyl-D-glutamate--2,6-diaminopimelate ligase
MENYCDTKAILFNRCKKAVANQDDPWFDRMCGSATCDLLTTSVQAEQGLYAKDLELLSDGIRFTATCDKNQTVVNLPIPGKFTVYNAMTALGCAMQLGINLTDAAKALETAKGIKGRVEVVPTPGKDYTVLIDYAHTPDGLENVLSAVKKFCKGRLIAVFGCGGDRDPVKRPIMGRIGTEIADYAIITSDNPRTEDPMKIIQDILNGVDLTKNTFEVLENRPKAICRAMDIAQKNDIIVLAGKGHETYQEICGVKHHLDEREVVAAYLEETRNI